MGLTDRAKKLVTEKLRPWLQRDVSPAIKVSVSEMTVVLPLLEFDVEALNRAGMESSPLLIKSMKVESIHLTLAPFRQPVLVASVQGWHVDLEPRSAEDVWWEKKEERVAEQKRTAALEALDPQGASVHTAAEGLADGKADSSLITQFLTSLMLTSVSLHFQDCSLRLVSHVDRGSQHVCTIPLSSFEFGGHEDGKGFSWSGGLMGAVTAALSGVWTKNSAPISKDCVVKGFGLLVETHRAEEGDGHGSRREETQQESVDTDIDPTASSATHEVAVKKIESHVVLLEKWVLGIRFTELAVDSLEFEVSEFAVGLELEEIFALQVLSSQIQGPTQDSPSRESARKLDLQGVSGAEDAVLPRRNASDLWKTGIQKAMALSSHRRLTNTLQAGILRSRYSSLYESWLQELGWGQRQDDAAGKKRKKRPAQKITKLTEDICELQKNLPIEAIALGRRLARHRVSSSRNLNEDAIRNSNSRLQDERSKKADSSFQTFMASFWRIVGVCTVLMQGQAMWMSAALSYNKWKSMFGRIWESKNDENLVANDDSEPVSELESSLGAIVDSTCAPENYFQLSSLEDSSENEAFPKEKKRAWGMLYTLKVRRGSITLAGRAIKALHRGKEKVSSRGKGELQLESAVIPAIHFSWQRMVLAYGSTGNASGTSVSCGSLEAELLSVIPSQLSQRLSETLDSEVFRKEFSSLGRWTSKKGDRVLLLSSSACPQQKETGSQATAEHPLAGEIYNKHWAWQKKLSESWSSSWPKPRGSQEVSSSETVNPKTLSQVLDDYERPFLIAEVNNLEDGSSKGAYPGGLTQFSLGLGKLDLVLKGSSFTCICHLLQQLKVSQTPTEHKHTENRIKPQIQSHHPVSLEEFWDDSYSKYLDTCRDSMVATIPKKSILFSAVVECPKLRVSATGTELYQHAERTDAGISTLKLHPSTEATVVFDFGLLELAMWPPKSREVVETSLQGVGSESIAPKDLWNHAVESKLWLKRPPASSHRDFVERSRWEHEQVGTNMYVGIAGVALALELGKESSKELPVFGPLALVIETSLCWDRYSSLLTTNKCVSAALSAKLSHLSVQSYIAEVAVVQQVVAFYAEVMNSPSGQDPIMVVEGRDTFLTTVNGISDEETALSSEKSRDSDSRNDSISNKEGSFTACTLTVSVELESFRLVLGNSRQEGDYKSNVRSAAGVEAKMRKKASAAMDEDGVEGARGWEQGPSGLVLGREAYVIIEDVAVGASLGDEENLGIFMGMKNSIIRIVDSGSLSTRNDFFSVTSMKPFPGLVLAEVALEYFSVKAFGASAHQSTLGERLSKTDSKLEELDLTQRTSTMQQENSDEVDGSESSPHLTEANLLEIVQTSFLDPASMTAKLNSDSVEKLATEDEGSPEQAISTQLEEASTSNPVKGETFWLAADVEVSKVLVTDGSIDVLLAKVVLVANGAENLHLDVGIDRGFQKICVGFQGGLVLVHTPAVATLVQFFGDLSSLVASPASPTSTTPELPQQPSSVSVNGDSEDTKGPSKSSVYRSASAPALPTQKGMKDIKRTTSAPSIAEIPVGDKSEPPLPRFEGVVFSKVTGFSLVLAKQSVNDSEGVLLELEMSTMLEVGDSAEKATFDLLRFTILGLPARAPGNSRRAPGRSGSRMPQFSSFKLASGADVQSLSGEPNKSLSSLQEASETSEADSGAVEIDQPKKDYSDQTLPEALSSSKEEPVVAGNSEMEGADGPQQSASAGEQAQGFQKSLSDFNSFILEHLSVHFAVEKARDEAKVWKWTNGWHGQCSVGGLDVAVTTSEIQLLEALAAPLSNIGGSSKPTGNPQDSGAKAEVEETQESSKETELEIPDGAIIALKDVYEHCYLATEEISTKKGQFRLVGVLHYTLAGEKALFKLKYDHVSTKNRNKDAWFSLLSLHAKDSDGESFRVHCRHGSGLADISPAKDGSWEKWRFVPAKLTEDENSSEVDIENPTNKHLFHILNQKSKSGISFKENVPLIVKQPGNPFKLKILAKAPNQSHDEDVAQTGKAFSPIVPSLSDEEAVGLVQSIPRIICRFDTVMFTVLHEAGGGLHLLPLLRIRIPGGEGIIHAGLSKTRTMLQCGIVLEHFESESSKWVSIVNPIETDVFYRARSTKPELAAAMNNDNKCPVAFFSRFRKVDVVFSEPSLDAVLFLIGALDLAGPFTLRYSPVQANRCLVKNHTGVDAQCQFDQGSSTKVGGMIPSWHSDSFLMRHMTSRRDSGPAKVASSFALYLQKLDKGATLPLVVSLGDPGVFAIRTRLQIDAGQKTSGPMIVVDVSRRGGDGIKVTVSPMVRIRNASGLSIELKCKRASAVEESAVVELEDGDTIDDSMAAFDALNLAGELRKALRSMNLGNYSLSVRPVDVPSMVEGSDSGKIEKNDHFEWSEDIKGAKPVQSLGVFDKLQFNFGNPAKAQDLKSTFGVVFCGSKQNSSNLDKEAGVYFLVRTTCRQVPISRPKTEAEKNLQQGGQYSVVAWQEQQEVILLPTVRVMNLTTANISVVLVSPSEARKMKHDQQARSFQKEVPISSFCSESMYVYLSDLLLILRHEDLGLTSKSIGIGAGSKEFSKSSNVGPARDIEMEVDFGDGIHCALVHVRRGGDGVLEVVFLTRYSLQNDSHETLLCCSARQHSSWWGGLRHSKQKELEWPDSGNVITMAPESRVSWFERSTTVLLKRTEPFAEAALLDLESVSRSMEISLRVHGPDSVDNMVQLGVHLEVPSAGDSNPSTTILLVPRYVVENDSSEPILVCQDGFQDTNEMISLAPGEKSALNAQEWTGQNEKKGSINEEVGPDLLLKVRFRPKQSGWNWSGPVCAAALGSFSVKIRRLQQEESTETPSQKIEDLWFAVLDVQEKESSLVMSFKRQPDDSIPYRIENALRSAAITYNQQGLENSEVLEPGVSVGYVWDDLGEPHTLKAGLAGTTLQENINPDKLRSWKSFRPSRGSKMGLLQLPFLNDLSRMAMYGDGNDEDGLPSTQSGNLPLIGYEVYADGPTRVVRICEERDGRVERRWQSDVSSPNMEIEMRVPIFTISIVEPGKQPSEAEKAAKEEGVATLETVTVTYVPVICLRLANVLIQASITKDFTFCQLKSERLDVDVKWNGAPVAAMLRRHGEDRFETGHTMLHTAVVISNRQKNPIQLKYASLLLQAIDVNLDEETLMKLVPFYRVSLSQSTSPSRQIYFERFEIHPIKIVGSFLPGNPRADYSSAQETLRALLHSVIKVPTVRGNTVELNGVLLSNALLTFKQLALKCAQHYSWYAMRAIYIARGSKLLPPGFASLFDDSAASSLDVFFDPSSGAIDLQGLTLGMFGMLRRGLRKKGKGGGTHRYLGDLRHTVKAAGSNILFAAVTEVSDSVLKGADAHGFEGALSGFRRGVLNVAMKPSVLRGAVVHGGATRRIKLDRIVGANEAYIEGYLQATLDALFKQSYVRIKVMDDQVLLKNLPPNTTLMEEMVQCVRDFLIGEGLLAGESSEAALSSLRRLQGEDERKFGPTVVALGQQLLVIVVVRFLRRQTIRVLRQNNITIIGQDQPEIQDSSKQNNDKTEEEKQKEQQPQGFFEGINFKRAVTGFALSSALAYVDGRICRHIPNPLLRRMVSGFLLSFVE